MFKYSIVLQWSDEDEGYVATISELPGVSAVGETPEKAVAEVQDAAVACIESMEDLGETVPEPNLLPIYSGQLRVRMPHTLHARLATRAQIEGVSLNSFILHLLSSNSEHHAISNEIGKKEQDRLMRASSLSHMVKEESKSYSRQPGTRQRPDKKISSKRKATPK